VKILIAGDDEAALRLAEGLMAAHEVWLLVPEGAAASASLERLDVEVVTGTAMSRPTLARARAESADVFIACTSRDEENIVACVLARQAGVSRTICFLFRPDVASDEEEDLALARTLGIDSLIRPARQLSDEILRIVRVPGALDVEVLAGGRVQLLRHAVEEGAALTRGTLKDVGVPEGVVLVMAKRGEDAFLPKGDTRFEAGDKVTVMGTVEGIDSLLRRLLRAPGHRDEVRRATVVGGGVVGLSVAQGLERAGWTVRVIERGQNRCEEISGQLRGLVLHGDGANLDLLRAERVGEDPVLVAVTSSDEKNLLVSLLAKKLEVPRIVTRADSPGNERLFEAVGIDVVLSARGAAIQTVLAQLAPERRALLSDIEHGDAEVIELDLPPDLAPVPLAALKTDVFAIVGAILREGRVIIPRGADALQGRDRILVFCTKQDDERVRDFFLRRVARLEA
jgi:trk system potassium uptake protein